jgi:MIP family channel proteins
MALFPPLPPFADVFRRAVAEFIGTFALVFIGAGSVLAAAPETGAGTLEVALASGLVVGVMVSALAHISGGHFNPAITLAFLITRRLSAVLAVAYFVVQLAAAALAALLLRWIYPEGQEGTLGAPALGPDIEQGSGLVVEAMLTFFLVWVVFATLADPRGSYTAIAGLAVGFVIAFDTLMGASLTGAAMNPARAFGPELVANVWSDAWIWYVGPLAGGAIAALLYDELFLRSAKPVPPGPPETGVEEPGAGMAASEIRVGVEEPPRDQPLP